mgnify:CR=1 FL=1
MRVQVVAVVPVVAALEQLAAILAMIQLLGVPAMAEKAAVELILRLRVPVRLMLAAVVEEHIITDLEAELLVLVDQVVVVTGQQQLLQVLQVLLI